MKRLVRFTARAMLWSNFVVAVLVIVLLSYWMFEAYRDQQRQAATSEQSKNIVDYAFPWRFEHRR